MTATHFRHYYANLKEVRLHYVTLGQGKPVILLHGWPQMWYEWRLIMPLLADQYQLIAPDRRGLGDSSRPLTGYDKKTVANDIWQLMHDHLGHEKFAVVGHDVGAVVAFRFAADHSDAVIHLTLLRCASDWDRHGQIGWTRTCRTIATLASSLSSRAGLAGSANVRS